MARPSLKTQRREQIINAAMSCVAQHGVSGLTLGRVAEIADLARPLIRHNVGNREQLVEAVTQNFIDSSKQQMAHLTAHLQERLCFTTTIDYLFDTKNSDTTLMLVAEALIAESSNDPKIAKVMRNWLTGFVKNLESLAIQEFPKANKEKCLIVATGITGIYFTVDSMIPIGGLSGFTRVSKKAALMLLDKLC